MSLLLCFFSKILSLLKNLADIKRSGSLADRLRNERFRLFLDFIHTPPHHLKIIYLGGRRLFRERMSFSKLNDVEIILLNISTRPTVHNGFINIVGDIGDPNTGSTWLNGNFSMGCYKQAHDKEKAMSFCCSKRLLNKAELARFFTGSRIQKEKFCGLTKSFIVLR